MNATYPPKMLSIVIINTEKISSSDSTTDAWTTSEKWKNLHVLMVFNYQAQKLLSPWFLQHCEHQDSLSTSGFSACSSILMTHFLYLLCNRNNTIRFWTPDCPLVICKKWAFGFLFGRELCFSLQLILFLCTALAVAAGSHRGQADQSNTALFWMVTLSTAPLLSLTIIFIPSHSPLTFKRLLIKKKSIHTYLCSSIFVRTFMTFWLSSTKIWDVDSQIKADSPAHSSFVAERSADACRKSFTLRFYAASWDLGFDFPSVLSI